MGVRLAASSRETVDTKGTQQSGPPKCRREDGGKRGKGGQETLIKCRLSAGIVGPKERRKVMANNTNQRTQ